MARKKKSNLKIRTFLKFFIIGTFVCFFIYIVYSRAAFFFLNARMFKIKEIIKSPSLQFVSSRHLERLEGQNIFSVDLQGIQRRVQSQYPSVDRLRILRRLPNRVIVTAQKREPFVVAAAGSRDVVLDYRGVVLGGGVPVRGSLPYLTGAADTSPVKAGRKFADSRVKVGLKIINEVKQNGYLNKFPIRSIDVSNLSKISLFINNIEIIMDRFKVEEKIETLGLLLSDAGIPLNEINYLDLRFKEPVINKK